MYRIQHQSSFNVLVPPDEVAPNAALADIGRPAFAWEGLLEHTDDWCECGGK